MLVLRKYHPALASCFREPRGILRSLLKDIVVGDDALIRATKNLDDLDAAERSIYEEGGRIMLPAHSGGLLRSR